MTTEQARRIVAAHDRFDRALLNLRNATAMMSDDPRAPQLLEEAGDSYAEALVDLRAVKVEAAPILASEGEATPIGWDDPGVEVPQGQSDPPLPPAPAPGSAPGAEAPAAGATAGQALQTPDPTGSPVFTPGDGEAREPQAGEAP